MDKKILGKTPREEVTEIIRAEATAIGDNEYAATAQEINPDILKLCFYQQVNGEVIEKYRIFLDKSDYITQDMTVQKRKWLTGRAEMVLDYGWWTHRDHDIAFVTDHDREVFDKWFPDNGETKRIWRLNGWQLKVIDRRRKDIHREECREIEELAKLTDLPIPDDFEEWIKETAHHNHYYMIYKPEKKRKIIGYCSHCHKDVELDRNDQHIRRGAKGICPECGFTVTFVTEHSSIGNEFENEVLIQKFEGGTVFRYFCSMVAHAKVPEIIPRLEDDHSYYESSRDICFDDGTERLICYGNYKNDCMTWFDASKYWNGTSRDKVWLYTKNAKEGLAGTPWQYSGAVEYQQKAGYRPIYFDSLLRQIKTKPYLEYLIKAGFINLVDDLCRYYWGWDHDFPEHAKTPEELFELPKAYINMLKQLNGDTGALRVLRQCFADKTMPDLESIGKYCSCFPGDDELIGVVDTHMSVKKFMNYLERQAGKHEIPHYEKTWGSDYSTKESRLQRFIKNLGHDWKDYVSWLAHLGYNTRDEYYLLPKDLVSAHDKLLREKTEHDKELESIRIQKESEAIEKIVKTLDACLDNNGKLQIQSRKYMAIVPRSAADLVEEGRHNHNCVGTYIDRVSKGLTMILFIRKVDDIDTPFYTMEFRNGQIIQCRGMRNQDAEGDVLAFSKAVARKLIETNAEQKFRKAATA
ncbi:MULTISPECIES: PcfJ domain-containing protein [unclassified Bilifractor]|uniref:PcfJ domain-containing protein n=1 Tax=unclassified Bilifractor TaxID=2815795 RepID=UPI003F8FC586